jgi:hypothetical protein
VFKVFCKVISRHLVRCVVVKIAQGREIKFGYDGIYYSLAALKPYNNSLALDESKKSLIMLIKKSRREKFDLKVFIWLLSA